MQLFILDRNPRQAAKMLCDKHLVKMSLETAQILSAVLASTGRGVLPDMPKVFNSRHPVIRAVNTPEKINWVLLYNSALQREYTYRFDKIHAYRNISRSYLRLLYDINASGEDLSFALVFKDFFSQENETIAAYRAYYRYKKQKMRNFVYTKRLQPVWLI